MGRLIDENSVMRMLTSIELNNGTLTDAKMELRNVKTAYNVEKVVAELKDKKYEAGIIAGIRGTKFGEDEYEEEPYHEGKKHAYSNAIEIVSKGGVE